MATNKFFKSIFEYRRLKRRDSNNSGLINRDSFNRDSIDMSAFDGEPSIRREFERSYAIEQFVVGGEFIKKSVASKQLSDRMNAFLHYKGLVAEFIKFNSMIPKGEDPLEFGIKLRLKEKEMNGKQ